MWGAIFCDLCDVMFMSMNCDEYGTHKMRQNFNQHFLGDVWTSNF